LAKAVWSSQALNIIFVQDESDNFIISKIFNIITAAKEIITLFDRDGKNRGGKSKLFSPKPGDADLRRSTIPSVVQKYLGRRNKDLDDVDSWHSNGDYLNANDDGCPREELWLLQTAAPRRLPNKWSSRLDV